MRRRERSLSSPDGEVVIIMRGRSQYRFRWQVQIRGRVVETGRGPDDLVATMRTASTRGDLYGEAAVDGLRRVVGILDAMEEERQ